MDTDATIGQAADLWKIVDRPNVLIKIPATKPGLPAITASIAEGISVNVTLIFSLERYRGVIDAYLTGLEQAAANGPRPEQDPVGGLVLRLPGRHRGRQAARRDRLRRGHGAEGQGRHRQRPARVRAVRGGVQLRAVRAPWRPRAPTGSGRCGPRPASRTRAYPTPCTSPSWSSPNTVNTMPEKTMQAFADHGEVRRRQGERHRGRGPAGARRPGPRSASPTTTWSTCWRSEGVREVRRVLGRTGRDRADRRSTRPRRRSTARARAPTRGRMTTLE